jgi:cAMP-dependent protein kinase regulator
MMSVMPEDDVNRTEYYRVRGTARRGSVSAEVVAAPPPKPRRLSTELAALVPEKTEQERQQLRDAVAKNFLFAHLDDAQMDMLVCSFDRQDYMAGETVIRQGDSGHLFYIVHSGTLSVYLHDKDGGPEQDRKVLAYGTGDSFGELAVHPEQIPMMLFVFQPKCAGAF